MSLNANCATSLEIMKTLKPNRQNKVRPSLYLEPQEMAQFEMLRKTLWPIEISQSYFFKHIFNEFKKSIGINA